MCPPGKSYYLDCETLQRFVIKELLPLIQFLFGLDPLKLSRTELCLLTASQACGFKKAVSIKKTNFRLSCACTCNGSPADETKVLQELPPDNM